MSQHALLSPSSAHRWLNCPLAPRLEAELPDRPSKYAAEGTLAHSVCEITAKKYFKKIKAAEYTRTIKKLKTNPLWSDEMLQTAERFVEHLSERAMKFAHEPYIAFEVAVPITEITSEPGAKGRCDNIMFSGDTLVVTDYKHGQGVPVSPVENPQMMLYALGALILYTPIFGGIIKNVELYIDQPRLNSYEGWTCGADELLDWGESVKPKAQRAIMGVGEYKAGDWCQFCRANGICKAQTDTQLTAFKDFSNVVDGTPHNHALLTPPEIGAALEKGKLLVEWYETLRTKALEMLLEGYSIPGWKAVEGRSNRAWTNQDKAIEAILAGGVERAIVYDSVPKSLAQLEKVLGTARFAELAGEFVTKPPGKPAIAPESDTRTAFNSAATDFAAVAKTEGT